jgi:putative Holliday junction resolvase
LIIYLEDLIKNENIEKVIIGKPLNLNNQLHELENDIVEFIESLQSVFPKIVIERVDERYTSKISSFIIRQSGVNKKSRMNKSIIDKISASLILESYLLKNKK